MPRFLLPVAGMAAAMLVLVAGTFGDLPSWRQTVPVLLASLQPHEVSAVAMEPAAAESSRSEPVSQSDGSRPRIQDLQAQLAADRQELATLRATADQARLELAALRERQRQDQVASVPRQMSADQNTAAARPVVASPVVVSPMVASPTVTSSSPGRVATAGNQAPAPAVTRAATTTPPPVMSGANVPDTGGPARPAGTVPEPSSGQDQALSPQVLRRLTDARAALAAGRMPRARWLLRVAKNQMSAGPGPSGQPNVAPADLSGVRLADAISLLNRGDSDGASRTLDQILAAQDPRAPDAARRNYRAIPASNRS